MKKKSAHSTYWWSMMTGKQTRPTSATVTKAEPAESVTLAPNFDTELAILTGQPMGTRPPTAESCKEMAQNVEEWTFNPRPNSIDGRREGWLAPEVESSTQGASKDGMPNWYRHDIEARKSWEAFWDRAITSEGLPRIPEDDGPPRLELSTHPPPDWEHLQQ